MVAYLTAMMEDDKLLGNLEACKERLFKAVIGRALSFTYLPKTFALEHSLLQSLQLNRTRHHYNVTSSSKCTDLQSWCKHVLPTQNQPQILVP